MVQSGEGKMNIDYQVKNTRPPVINNIYSSLSLGSVEPAAGDVPTHNMNVFQKEAEHLEL